MTVLGTHRGRTVLGDAFELPWAHVWTWWDGEATSFTEDGFTEYSFTEYYDAARLIPALGQDAPLPVPHVGLAPRLEQPFMDGAGTAG